MQARLYYYWDMTSNPAIWAASPEHYRELTGRKPRYCVRVAHVGIDPPKGYKKLGGELACDCVIAVRKVRLDKIIN